MSVRIWLTFMLTVALAALPVAALGALSGWTVSVSPITHPAYADDKKVDAFTLIQRSDRYRVNISYPATGNAVADEELAIWARDQATAFIRGVDQIPSPPPLPYELTISYETRIASPRTLSVIFTISSFMGGPHPEPGLATFVYDRQNGRRLTYDDLFLQRDNMLATLSEFCAAALHEQLREKAIPAMIKAGTAPEIANFDLFALSPQGLVIYFPPYQAASYDEGYLQVAVPFSVLEPFKPQMSFWDSGQAR